MIGLASRLTGLARRLGTRAWATLLLASLLTAVSVWTILGGLSFNSDLTDLLPADHPDLVTLRKIEATHPTDTGFMVLLSRNFHFAVDAQGRAMVHDGRVWRRQQTGAPLHAVYGFSPTDVFAAGEGGKVWRYAGKRWSPLAAPGASKATIRGLSGALNKKKGWPAQRQGLFAVGDGGLIQRFDGERWHPERSPAEGVSLRAVSVAGGRAAAVGDRGTVLLRQDTWHKARIPQALCGGAGGDAGETPKKKPGCDAVTFRGVWRSKGGTIVVVGDGGLMLRFEPARGGTERHRGGWRRVDTGTTRRLNAVWGTSERYVVAVGDGGTRLRFDGDKVIAEPAKVHQGKDLLAVHGVAKDIAWAAGDRCAYLRRTASYDFWWHEPLDTVDPAGSWPPPAFVADAEPCDSRFTAIWRPDNEMAAIKAFVPKLAAQLSNNPKVGRVEFRKPVQFFKDRALYYLPVKDLERLYQELKEALDRETAKASGLYVDLDDEEDQGGKGKEKSPRDKIEALLGKYAKQAQRLGRSELYEHYDGASVGIVVYPKQGAGNLANLRKLRGEIDKVIASSGYQKVDPLLRIDIGGDGVSKIREYASTINDITGLAWLAIVGIVLILAAYFRRLVGLLFVLVPLSMSITWTFALTTLTIGTLNTVTGFLFAVLFGLGIDYGLQMYGRYREERLAGKDLERAMDATVLETGRATVTSAATTSAALLTLTLADFRGFSEFGFIAGFGVLFSLVAFLLVLPALIRLAERFGLLRLKVQALPADEDAPARRRKLAPLRLKRLVLAASAVGVAYGVYGAINVEFEYNHRVLRSVGKPNEILSRSNHCFGGSMTPTIFLAGSRDELRAALDGLGRSRERLIAAGKTSPVRKTGSILAVVPERQAEKKRILLRADKLLNSKRWKLVSDELKRTIQLDQLRRMARAEPFTLDELPDAVRRGFHGPGFGDAWIGQAYYGGNLSDSRQARRLKAQIRSFAGSPWLSLGKLLPRGAKVWVEGQRVEVACGESLRARCRQALTALRHEAKPAFSKVVTTEQAYDDELAVEGGLRGDLLAIAADGLVPVARELPQVVAPSGRFSASSGELVLTEVVEVMLADARLAMGLALAAVFIFCLIDFRSLRFAVLACAPLGVGLLWITAVLHAFSLKLNMFNFVVLPALVGIGIDYGVHYVHRAKEGGGVPVAEVRGALYWVLLFCAATSVIGFGNMALANHPGLRSLGELAIVGLVCMFVASNYTLPALLELGRRRS